MDWTSEGWCFSQGILCGSVLMTESSRGVGEECEEMLFIEEVVEMTEDLFPGCWLLKLTWLNLFSGH